MAISESDIEAMESVIDGSPSPADAERVRVLQTDPEFAALMTELQHDRQLRVAAVASMEPDDVMLERFHWRLSGAVADAVSDERVASRRAGWGFARIGSTAAACVAVGFFGGWLGRGRPASTTPNGPVLPVVRYDPSGAPLAPMANGAPASSDILVPVSNEYGQVVAFQKFHNSDDARSFTEELNRVNNPAGDDRVKLMSNEKY